MRKPEYRLDANQLLKLVCLRFFGDTSSLVDVIVNHIPSSASATKKKLERIYSGKKDTPLFKQLS